MPEFVTPEANEIKDILTDGNHDSDKTACSLLAHPDSRDPANIHIY
jgi:hypothetical protein